MKHVLAKFLPPWLTDQQEEEHLSVSSDLHVHTDLMKLSSKKHTTCIKTWVYSTQNRAAVLTTAVPFLGTTNEQHNKHAHN
jgi:hypothetical protein